MTIWDINKIMKSGRGSVLMEFVLVLPVYIAVMGGTLWIGMKSLDAINLRSADHWSVWSEGNRFQMRMPALIALRDMFPRATLITTSAKRRLEAEHSYLQFIGSKTTIMETKSDYISAWIDMPYTMSGESKPVWDLIPELFMTSSRYDNKYTQCIIMRSKASRTAKRHWHSSLVADPDRDIWKFEGNEDKYPSKWELKLFDNVKYSDDNKEESKEPKKIDFYERYSTYEDWSLPEK